MKVCELPTSISFALGRREICGGTVKNEGDFTQQVLVLLPSKNSVKALIVTNGLSYLTSLAFEINPGVTLEL